MPGIDGQGRASGWVAVAGGVASRPTLWPTALRQARRLTGAGWWRRPPFLPVPDRGWLRFRALTQYGDERRKPERADVLGWLEWGRDADRVRRHRQNPAGPRPVRR